MRPATARKPTRKLNCWEFKQCGREKKGRHAPGEEVCPAVTEVKANGVNGGRNGGRVCWAIAGTLCGGHRQGSFVAKLESCLRCDFCQFVLAEERTEPCEKYPPPKLRS